MEILEVFIEELSRRKYILICERNESEFERNMSKFERNVSEFERNVSEY